MVKSSCSPMKRRRQPILHGPSFANVFAAAGGLCESLDVISAASRVSRAEPMSPGPLPDPPALSRRRLGGPALEELKLQLETITPVLGGAPTPRQLDTVDFIRAPTVRGHLRFWW